MLLLLANGEPKTFFLTFKSKIDNACETTAFAWGVWWFIFIQASCVSLYISICLTLPDSQWPAIQECETGENAASALCDK